MARVTKPRTIRAAGGILWRRAGEGAEGSIEVAIIHRPRYDDWSIPKGKLAPGESDIEGAVREVYEETGFRVHVGRPLGEVRYTKRSGGVDHPKVVRYWAMEAEGGRFVATREVDELRWLTLDAARALVSRDHDRDLFDRFARGPRVTGTVLVVRHAPAGSRSRWEGDDRLRPLDERGWEEAESLVRLLSRFEVERIISADFVRCTQTVEPLADAIGVPIESEPVVSEFGYPGNETKAVDLVRSLGEEEGAAVVCTQGDVIPDLIARLAAEDHFDLPEPLEYKKGSVWSLTFDGPRLFSADYFPPPFGD